MSHYTIIQRSRVPYEPDVGFYITNDARIIILQGSGKIADKSEPGEKLPASESKKCNLYRSVQSVQKGHWGSAALSKAGDMK